MVVVDEQVGDFELYVVGAGSEVNGGECDHDVAAGVGDAAVGHKLGRDAT